ncbi:hypothetical protein CANARDRAFT_204072 [[Candida] arabinofermentans NRRL YB-2248]|uniref:Protein kinase domain-containing protein n=1 Tax=[Candida] arabinofermentans NRRL YB-2248 TaxID=983967 RepID=A0A1E4STW4_9ASCO|nr:hypothetical protein CANARDRAFT_204072 [[Candida] arabinofermentans NRRL YB-2248]
MSHSRNSLLSLFVETDQDLSFGEFEDDLSLLNISGHNGKTIKITNDLTKEQFNHYKIDKIIGKGAFGDVYKVKNVETDLIYAMKSIDIPNDNNDNKDQTWMNEVLLMKQFNHDNVVKLNHYYISSNSCHLIMEYCNGGSLRDLYQKSGCLNEFKIVNFTIQILNGLQYLHNNNFVHSDIKASNILLKDNIIKLADFGVSEQIDLNNPKKKANGSPYWMAPEVIRLKGVTPKSDIWSLGATIIELLTCNPPFYNLDPFPACHAIGSNESIPIPNNISIECFDFLKNHCFIKDPLKRSGCDELLNHPCGCNELLNHPWLNKMENNNNGKIDLKYIELNYQDDDYEDDFEIEKPELLYKTIRTINKKQRLKFYKDASLEVFKNDLNVLNFIDDIKTATFEQIKEINRVFKQQVDVLNLHELIGSKLVSQLKELSVKLFIFEKEDCLIDICEILINLFQFAKPTVNDFIFNNGGDLSKLIKSINNAKFVELASLLIDMKLRIVFFNCGGTSEIHTDYNDNDDSDDIKVFDYLPFNDNEPSNEVLIMVEELIEQELMNYNLSNIHPKVKMIEHNDKLKELFDGDGDGGGVKLSNYSNLLNDDFKDTSNNDRLKIALSYSQMRYRTLLLNQFNDADKRIKLTMSQQMNDNQSNVNTINENKKLIQLDNLKQFKNDLINVNNLQKRKIETIMNSRKKICLDNQPVFNYLQEKWNDKLNEVVDLGVTLAERELNE